MVFLILAFESIFCISKQLRVLPPIDKKSQIQIISANSMTMLTFNFKYLNHGLYFIIDFGNLCLKFLEIPNDLCNFVNVF